MNLRAILLTCLLPLGCTAQVGVSGTGLKVPSDGLAQCQSQCSTMGMRTSAVVAMAGRIGCVCEPTGTADKTAEQSAAITGGMAAIVAQEQQQQQQPPPPPQ